MNQTLRSELLRPTGTRGVALVLVLAFLVILAGVILAFFSSVTNESLASSRYAAGTNVRVLADSVTSIVQAQIRDATYGLADANDASSMVTWASQPGMIRTYDKSGQPDKVFKLYSADETTLEAGKFAPDLNNIPKDWDEGLNRDLYTDLNAPVPYVDPEANPPLTSSEALIYPIVDPRAAGVRPGDPNRAGQPQLEVEGFSFVPLPSYDAQKEDSPTNNPVAMPVKWLYLLQDGTLAKAEPSDASEIKIAKATRANPIIGRIAFWADDESAKININTASEGVYWDVPRVYSMEDFGQHNSNGVVTPGLSVCQPSNREFQRYPGHPATTSLSTVLGRILPVPPVRDNPTITATNATQFNPYYDIAPRVGDKSDPRRSSMGGTRKPAAVTVIDSDRLYASVEELMFSPVVNSNGAAGAFRMPNAGDKNAASPKPGQLTRRVLEQAKFFLTANSSAPETTLFNTPRISMWPVHRSAAKRTGFDELSAFCGTIGKPSTPRADKAYYFDRLNPRSATDDYSGRNKTLYRYLQAMTGRQIPGFGGSFVKKYPALLTGPLERDQILTYIYDYIRCTNLQDRSKDKISYTELFQNGVAGAGEVVPIQIENTGTQGFGRFYTVSEACLLFFGNTGAPIDPSKPDGPKYTTSMRSLFFMEYFTPQHGLGTMRPALKYTVTGLDRLQVRIGQGAWQPLGFSNGGTNFFQSADLGSFHGRSVGGTEGVYNAMAGKTFVSGTTTQTNSYPFITNGQIPVGRTDQTFGLRMEDPQNNLIRISISSSDTNVLIQTITLQFPETELKIPGTKDITHDFSSRMGGPFNLIRPKMEGDVVVSVEPSGALGWDPREPKVLSADPQIDSTGGDTRMIAGLRDVPAWRYRAHADYRKAVPPQNRQFAHGLVSAIGLGSESENEFPTGVHKGGTYGKLVNVAASGNPARPYGQTASGNARQPDVPSRVGNAVTRLDLSPGDWDTGFGDQKDGPYINKPDEGDTAFNDNQNGEIRPPYLLGFNQGFAAGLGEYFSPNRQIPSPLMLGSIPTGVQRFRPWQTLLFHPRPEDPQHPGRESPPDHLLADLFWMPVVEPYAISQPFATSGKINMNYQIQPFTHIRRDTGLRAVMKSTKFLALPLAASSSYKPLDPGNNRARTPNARKAIDLPTAPGVVPNTLKAFDVQFKAGLFRSATQICEINLMPAGVPVQPPAGLDELNSAMAAFWRNNPLTGDNVREKPYVDIYPRLTTKSNVYNIHMHVQVLKKAANTPPDQWVQNRDQVLSEYRGSSIVERYIDANDSRLPDFASQFAANPSDSSLNIDQYYRMRVVSTKTFTP